MRALQVLTLTFFCLGATCYHQTVLDIESCLDQTVAKAAAPLLQVISADLLDPNTTTDDVKAQLLALAVTYGTPAVLCALDSVVRDLGGGAATKTTSATSGGGSVAQRAAQRGTQAREALLASLHR